MRRILIAAAALCLAGAAYTRLVVAPWYLQRLAPGTEWRAEYVGFQVFPDPRTGDWPTTQEVAAYAHHMRIADESGRPEKVVVEDTYTARDATTGRIDFEYIVRDEVDPGTGTIVGGDATGDHYVLPRFAERRAYPITSSYLRGIELKYEGEEVVAGLSTYIYEYRGDIEYTFAYSGSPNFPGVQVAADEEIRCRDAQFQFRAWVEPVTGEIVKVQESCRSGDYVYARASGRPLRPIAIWGGETAAHHVAARARQIGEARSRILLTTNYLPGALLVASLAALVAAALFKRR